MAAYAALVSLTHLVNQIEQHPCPPIFLDKKQVESLTEKIIFFQDFLEAYNIHENNQELESLRSRIADAAYAAEDLIENCIVDQIYARRDGEEVTSLRDSFEDHADGGSKLEADGKPKNISPIELYQGLSTVIENMDVIKRESLEFQDEMGNQDHLCRNPIQDRSIKPLSMGQKSTMVGFDDVLIELMDKLTGGQSTRQIIPIVGMGGIGKTTLARNVYINKRIQECFDIRAWVTVSQEHNIREILIEILCQMNQGDRESLREKSEKDLGLQLYQSLIGRRYLIIMDDMWDLKAWEKIKFFFPVDKNGSRIVITTRLSKLASHLTDTYMLKMSFLDEDKSWNLLCKIVFGEEGCPSELKEIGKEIARNCKGLPLSITVIGGLLAKSNGTLKYWEYVAENLNSIVSLEDDERCLKILRTSYNLLPIHLKSCFLYVGIFPEDYDISASELIKLWVAEGFLKPISGESLEESAWAYLMDLIDRNLILVSIRGISGKVKFFKIHDLLRDLCLTEARNENFICLARQHSLRVPFEDISTQRRIVIQENTSKENDLPSLQLEPVSITRSLICYPSVENLEFVKFRLLRVLKTSEGKNCFNRQKYSLDAIFQLVNSRFLYFWSEWERLPSSIYLLWNLQTLILDKYSLLHSQTLDIWKMPLVRHVKLRGKLYLPELPSGHIERRDDFVLWNLQTLGFVRDFECNEEVVKRIPSIKKLKLRYEQQSSEFEVASRYCLNNLGHLHKLESLTCEFDADNLPNRGDLLQNLNFPQLLKKLVLKNMGLYWKDMVDIKIGLLPHLQVLKLYGDSFIGPVWVTVEQQFPSLKYLEIHCRDLIHWTTESNHFPRLEQLILHLSDLEEIPSEIGEIPTLQLIELFCCSDSAVISAKRILEEQEDLGNESLQVEVWLLRKTEHLLNLASHNFKVI